MSLASVYRRLGGRSGPQEEPEITSTAGSARDHTGHPDDAPLVRFTFNGIEYLAREGQTLVVALLAHGERPLGTSPIDGSPRGAFCLMGICQDCVVHVGTRRMEACRLRVSDHLVVTS